MAKNIKQVAHDLTPLADAMAELGSIVSSLLETIKPHAQFNVSGMEQHFDQCELATEKLTLSAEMVKAYIEKLHQEADRAGIVKD